MTYEPLQNYGSVLWDTQGFLQAGARFEMPWGFSFFDTTLYSIDYVERASVYEGASNNDYEMLLFTSVYDFDMSQTLEDLFSDIRYADTIINGNHVLIVEHTHMRLDSDPSIAEFDSHVNFQSWFWEDGKIDIVFGSCNLDNSPLYKEGEGMRRIVVESSTGHVDTMNIGPEFRLTNPSNTDEFVSFWSGDDHTDFTVSTTFKGSRVLWLPPEGYRYRCTPVKPVRTVDGIDETDSNCYYPNPTGGKLTWSNPRSFPTQGVTVSDLMGRQISLYTNVDEIDIGHLPSGHYILRYVINNTTNTQRIIKL